MNKDEAILARDLAAMTTKLQSANGARPPENQVRLQQAVRTLRAIRQRYEMGRNVDSDYVRAYSLQVALGYADMFWITAAIEALEKAIGDEAKPTDSTTAEAQPKA
jgi:hypothetical protein